MKLKPPFILALAVCFPFLCSASTNVQARFQRSLNDARSLTNLEVCWLDSFYLPDPTYAKSGGSNAPHFLRVFEYSYIASGGKYRGAWKLVSANQTNLDTLFESAFDGAAYNTYSRDRRYFTTGAKQPDDVAESVYSPLIAPFMFLSKYTDGCRNCLLRFSDIVAMEPTNGINPTAMEISDRQIAISMEGLIRHGKHSAWKIFLNADGDAFTPQTILYTEPGKLEQISRFLDYTNLGGYQFPGRIEWIMRSPGPPATLLATGTVTLVSARIPDQIEGSVFTLEAEKKGADVIWNGDQNKLVKEGPRIRQPPGKAATSVAVRVVLFTMILIPPAIVVWKRAAARTQNRV